MRIYLHILDPQVLRVSFRSNYLHPSLYDRALKLILLSWKEPLLFSSAHAFENPYLLKFITDFGVCLIQGGHLIGVQSQNDIDDLIYAKRLQYSHVKKNKLHSQYWDKEICARIQDTGIYVETSSVESGSIIELRLINVIATHRTILSNLNYLTPEASTAIFCLQNTIESRGNKALTIDLFKKQMPIVQSLHKFDLAFEISRAYTIQQIDKNNATIYTNFPFGFHFFDSIVSNGIDWAKIEKVYSSFSILPFVIHMNWQDIAVVRESPIYRFFIDSLHLALTANSSNIESFLQKMEISLAKYDRFRNLVRKRNFSASAFLDLIDVLQSGLEFGEFVVEIADGKSNKLFNIFNNFGSIGSISIEEKNMFGDQITQGDNNILVNRSIVQNAFNKVKSEHDEEIANALKSIEEAINKSGNKEAVENFESFNKELLEPEPKKSILKTLWQGTLIAMPALKELTNVVEQIVKLFS